MEDAQSSLELASQLENKGQVKDAYLAYLDTVKRSLQPLYDVKFIQTTVIQKPWQYASLISAMRSCLEHVETIIETHSPASTTPPHPGQQQSKGGDFVKIKPPLPPKPSRIQKPAIPPKPSRPNVSRAPSPTHDDDSGDMQPVQNIIPRRSPLAPANHRHSVPSPVDKHAEILPIRPHTECHATDTQAVSLNLATEYEIDPYHLVPAQINSNLCPDMQPSDVPLIPVPPLLTTHRQLQAELNQLEDELRRFKDRKRQVTASPEGGRTSLDSLSEDDLAKRILETTRQVADAKKRLNDVRTLYMGAATIENIIRFPAHVMAYQVTLIEAAIFKAIPPMALLKHSPKTPNKHIVASTDFFNYITRIIEHSIVLPETKSDRAQHIHYWVKVAQRCLDLNNYQTLKAIVSSLGTPQVQRLRQTWEYVPKKSLNKLEGLSELMSEASNYGSYREHMGMVNNTVVNGKSVALIRKEHYERPTVPFLGTLIHDITYLLAAFKSSPMADTTRPENEPRIRDVLHTMEMFQRGPPYADAPSDNYTKTSQRHGLGSTIFSASSAIHRSASGIRSSLFGGSSSGSDRNSIHGGTNGIGNSSPTASNFSSDNESDMNDGKKTEQLATQYILTRPWVNENTIDQLSLLREPHKTNSQVQQQSRARSSGGGSGTGSVLSSASSMMRFSSGSMSLHTSSTTGNGDSRPTSMEEDEEKNRGWPFRRSVDTHRPSSLSHPEGITVVDSTDNVGKQATAGADAPLIPPRPGSMQENDDFRVALAQKLAKTRKQY